MLKETIMIKEELKSFMALMPEEAGQVQRQEMKRSFIAGAVAFLHIVNSMAVLNEEEAIQKLEATEAELIELVAEVMS